MSLSVKSSISEQEIGSSSSNGSSNGSSQLKIYQTFIFSVPIFFTFILLFLFYWFYLRRRRADWSSLRMRANNSVLISETGDDLSRCELGLKKELREMLPIIVFNQSFSVKDTQCSVCLGEYQAEDKLQQIPSCGHTFHMDCIDLWLTTHTTCPLCRHSLLASTKPPPDTQPSEQTNEDPQTSDEEGAAKPPSKSPTNEDPQTSDEEGAAKPPTNEDPQTSEPPSEGDDEERAAAAATGRDHDTRCDDEEGAAAAAAIGRDHDARCDDEEAQTSDEEGAAKPPTNEDPQTSEPPSEGDDEEGAAAAAAAAAIGRDHDTRYDDDEAQRETVK